jgi:flagellar hook-associated protein 2
VDVSAPSLLAASVTEGASPGIHSVRVMAIASAETLGSDLFASRATSLGLAGELRVAATRIEVEAGDSLDDVARRFNDVSGTTGVTASVLNTGTGACRLILATRNTGAGGIDLVDGSAGVLRSLGFLDASAGIKNGTTSGARGDRFSDGVTAVGGLLGFTAARPETIDLGGVSVTLDLNTMSLTDIAGAINVAASTAGRAIAASVIDDGTGKRLDVRNTTAFTDAGRILEALGVLEGGRGAEAHVIQSDVLGDGGSTPATAATLLSDLWTRGAPAQVQAGDTLTVTGTRGDGTAFTIGFTIGAGDDLQDLLNGLNGAADAFGAGSRTARASVASGRIRVTDDTRGSSRQDLRIVSHNQGGGSLDFGIFGVASAGRARQITAGADAEVEVDGSYLRQASNRVSDAVPGLTLRLGAADPDTTVVVEVSDDAEANMGAIRALIEACNDLSGFADSQLRPPPEGQAPAPLFNDGLLRTMRSTLHSVLSAVLEATVTGGPARLLDIGIEIDRHGRYTIDAQKLADAVARQGEAVARLFGVCGTVSGAGLTWLGAFHQTVPGRYAIDVTRLAMAANVTGAGFGGTYVDDASADTLTVRDVLNGGSYPVALVNGMTMSEIVSALNAELATAKAHRIAARHSLTEGGGAFVSDATSWADVNCPAGRNSGVAAGDVLTISGTRTDGSAFATSIPVGAAGTLGELRVAVQSAIGADVEVFWDDGALSARTKAAGSTVFTLDVTSDNAGGGRLDLGGFAVRQEGRGVSGIGASDAGGQLRLVHDEFGSAAGFEISFTPGGADGSASLGFAAGRYVGIDVAGTIGGFAATGAGRVLTGGTGFAVQGLAVAYEGSTTGAVGSVTFSRGIGSGLERLGQDLLGDTAGSVEAVSDRIERSIALMQDRVEALESRLERRRAELIARFSAMEQAMSLAQSQSAWLEAQIQRLPASPSA